MENLQISYKEYLSNKRYIHSKIIIEDVDFSESYSLLYNYIAYFETVNSKDAEVKIVDIGCFVWNNISYHKFLDGADAISADVYFLADALSMFFADDKNIRNIMIIDSTCYYVKLSNEEKYLQEILKWFKKALSFMKINGIKYVALQSKALILELSESARKNLVDFLLKMSFIPFARVDGEDLYFIKQLF